MCSQIGIVFGTKKCKRDDTEYLVKLFGWLFTYLLLLNEKRGPHATGAALLKSDGEHILFKRPLRASEFVKDKGFRDLLWSVDARTTLLMGHTRWQTIGDASNNANNHPLRTGEVIGTANGTILNADDLFDHLELPRHAEVDSELIFRIADATLDRGCLDADAIKTRLALCQGQLSAVMASRQDPKKVMIVKGNRPLELRYHSGHDVVVYCTHASYLDVALAGDDDWRRVRTRSMSLMTFDCDDLPRFTSRLFKLAAPGGRGRFVRFTGGADDE